MVENKDICNYVLDKYYKGLVCKKCQTLNCTFEFNHISYDDFLRIQEYAKSKKYYLTDSILNIFLSNISNLENISINQNIEQGIEDKDILIGEILRLYYDNESSVDVLKVNDQEYIYDGMIPNYNKSYIRVSQDCKIGKGKLYCSDGKLLMDISQVELLKPTLYHRRMDSFYDLSKASVSQNRSLWPLLNMIIELSYKSSMDINKIFQESKKYGIGIFTLLYLLKPNIYDKSNC